MTWKIIAETNETLIICLGMFAIWNGVLSSGWFTYSFMSVSWYVVRRRRKTARGYEMEWILRRWCTFRATKSDFLTIFFSLAVCVMAFLCFSCQWKKDSTEEWRDREREKRKKKLWLLRLWFKRNALFNWKLVKQKYQWKEFHFFSKDSNLQPIITNWTSLLAFSFGKIVRGNGADVGTLRTELERQTNSLLSRKIKFSQVFHLGKYLREARMQS